MEPRPGPGAGSGPLPREVEAFRKTLRAALPSLRESYKVSRLSLFGSHVRGEARGDSDLDVLVEFSDPPGLLEFVALERELGQLLGVRVDLVMRTGLKPHLGEQVLREAVPV